jgi:GNAT superfamily N-acetyltransferase
VGAQPLLHEEPIRQVYVRTFQPGDEPEFRRLNEEWIRRYFEIEDKDRASFDDPQHKIIDRGGEIFMAILDGETVGCVALLKSGDCSYELAKMAVDERFQRRGIGRAVIRAAIEWARNRRARRIWLETNHALTPAIALYSVCGFTPIPPERVKPSAYKRADVFLELWLEPEWVRYL